MSELFSNTATNQRRTGLPVVFSTILHGLVVAIAIWLPLSSSLPSTHPQKSLTVVPLVFPVRQKPVQAPRGSDAPVPPSAAAKNPVVISKAAEFPVVKIQDDLNPKLIQPKFISGDLDRISVGGLNKVGRASDGHTGVGGAVRPTNGFAPNRSRGAPIVPAIQCGSDEDARLLSTPAPVYTEEAQRLNVTGDVLIEVEMAADGKVHFRRLLRGLGHGLDEAAIAAVNQTRCQPAFKCGRPIDVIKTIRVKFRLT